MTEEQYIKTRNKYIDDAIKLMEESGKLLREGDYSLSACLTRIALDRLALAGVSVKPNESKWVC